MIKMQKFLLYAIMFLTVFTTNAADNLIHNSDLNAPLAPEYSLYATPGHMKLDIFTEDSTWNKCAKLEILNFIEKDGIKDINGGFTIGGDKNKFGFSAKPDTTYAFAFELKGNAQRAFCAGVGWNEKSKYHEMQKLKSTSGRINVNPDWTRYKGTFKTGAQTNRAALKISLWGTSKNNQLLDKPGDYILVDNVLICEQPSNNPLAKIEKSKTGEIKVPAICPPIPLLKNIPSEEDWNKAPEIKNFSNIATQKPVENDTSAKLLSDGKNIYLMIQCNEKNKEKIKASQKELASLTIWKDDVVEIFFGPVVKDRLLSQFVVSAGGGRWMGRGGNNNQDLRKHYQDWSADVSVKDDGWKTIVKIPVALLGKNDELKSGDYLSFNIGRQRVADKEISSWSKVMNNFHECENFGLLVFGSAADYGKKLAEVRKTELKTLSDTTLGKDILKDIADLESGKLSVSDSYRTAFRAENEIKSLKFAGMCFTVGRMSPTANPTLPLELEQLDLGNETLKIRAAINEKLPLPLAITNRTDKTAEYQVLIVNDEKGPDAKLIPESLAKGGLKGFPVDQIEFRRGVIVKDSDSSSHELRFDPLPKMNEAKTISIAPSETGLVWLNFDCSNVPSGTYKGKLKIIPLSEKIVKKPNPKGGRLFEGPIREIPIEMEILPIILPEETEIPLWLMGYGENENFWNYYSDAGGRMIHINPWWMKMKFSKDGSILETNYKFADGVVAKHVDWIKKSNIKKGPFFALAFHAFPVFEKVHAKASGLRYGTPEFAEAWKNWLGEFQKIMKKHGISSENYVVEIWDEPFPKDYDKLIEICKLTKKQDPGIPIQITFAAFSFEPGLKQVRGLVDYCDYWAVWGPHFSRPEYLDFTRELAAKGKKVWNYVCNTSMRESLYRYYRLLPWLGRHYGHDANGLYAFINSPDGSYGVPNWKCAALGGTVYGLAGNCIPSIRYECLCLGDTDIKYLGVLQRLIEKTPETASNKAALAEARQFFEKCSKDVLIDHPYNEKGADEARNKVIDYIMLLQNEQTGKKQTQQ